MNSLFWLNHHSIWMFFLLTGWIALIPSSSILWHLHLHHRAWTSQLEVLLVTPASEEFIPISILSPTDLQSSTRLSWWCNTLHSQQHHCPLWKVPENTTSPISGSKRVPGATAAVYKTSQYHLLLHVTVRCYLLCAENASRYCATWWKCRSLGVFSKLRTWRQVIWLRGQNPEDESYLLSFHAILLDPDLWVPSKTAYIWSLKMQSPWLGYWGDSSGLTW